MKKPIEIILENFKDEMGIDEYSSFIVNRIKPNLSAEEINLCETNSVDLEDQVSIIEDILINKSNKN